MQIYPCVYQCSNGTPRDLATLLALRSQGFGENVDFYLKATGTQGHAGMDWPCAVGTPAYASVAGKISYISSDFRVETGQGAGVIIQTPEGECLEWHLSRIDVKVGDMVTTGQQIGLTGDSGFSTGPHIHLEWRPFPLAYNNGFFGAVDYTSLMVWQPLPSGTKPMTAEEVTKEYVLAFYRQPTADELAYWTGKPVLEFLDTAIADRGHFLLTQI